LRAKATPIPQPTSFNMDNDQLTNYLIRYESEGLCEAETIELFQYLVDTGLAWRLQGFYGRQAMALIEMGAVTRPKEPDAPKAISNAGKKKPKLKRGRPSTKQVGAMVEMGQRRRPGNGIIIDRLEDIPIDELERGSKTITAMSKKGYVGWGIIGSTTPAYHSNFVLVHWFNPPSEYTDEQTRQRIHWYPDKWVKVISPAKKK